MAIDDLRRRIFQKDENFSKRYQEPQLAKHKEKPPVSWHEPEQAPPDVEEGMAKERKTTRRIIWWGLGGGLAVIIGFAIFLLLPGGFHIGADSQKAVSLQVEGGEEVTAGKKVTWKVRYKNENQIALDDVTITFEYPETAQPLVGDFSREGLKREKRDLGSIAPGTQGEETFSAIVFGAKDAQLSGRAILEYRPHDSSARFLKETSYTSRVTATLLGATFEVPENLQAGQEVDIPLRITSNAESVYKDVSVIVQYPEAFEFQSAEPVPARGNDIWHLGDVTTNGEYRIVLHGKIKQSDGPQTFRADIGQYDNGENSLAAFFTSATQSFSVTQSLLSLAFTTDSGEVSSGVIQAGQTLMVTVNWANNLPVAVRNVNIEVSVKGDVLDLRTLQSSNGEAQVNSNTLKWLAARIPSLTVVDPGESGKFSFKVATVKNIPQTTSSDKNFTVTVSGSITTPDGVAGYSGVDISGRTSKEYKVASRVVYAQKGYYYDTRIPNTGPLPPRVGQETTYTIVWSLLNTVNDIKDVEVSATIPSYLRWTGAVMPADTSLKFNESTRELVWRPGTIAAGTGFLQPAREVSFQVGLTPALPQVKKQPELISAAIMKARDAFTDTLFTQNARAINTSIPDDAQVKQSGASVVE